MSIKNIFFVGMYTKWSFRMVRWRKTQNGGKEGTWAAKENEVN